MGGFSFPFLGLGENAQLRVVTVGKPEVSSAVVGFQLLTPGRSVNEGGTVVKAATPTVSRFDRTVRIRHRGLYRALIKINDGSHVSNYSAPVVVR